MFGDVEHDYEHDVFSTDYGSTDESESAISTAIDISAESSFEDFIHLQADESDVIQASTYQADEQLCSPTLAHLQ
jgi:threonine synthase